MTTMRLGHIPGMRVLKPIDVDLFRESGGIVAWSDVLEVWGEGDDETSAIRDLQRSIVELYDSLTDTTVQLAPRLIRQRDTMLTIIERRHHA